MHLNDKGKTRKLEQPENKKNTAKWPTQVLQNENRDLILEKRFQVNAFLVASKHLGHFRQANRWNQLSPSGTAPSARADHTLVWSDVADGMFVFGGWGSRGLSDKAKVQRNVPGHSTASLRFDLGQ